MSLFFCLNTLYFMSAAFTLLQVDVYRRRLRERERQKCLLKDYGVVQSSTSTGGKRLQAIRAKQSKDERSAVILLLFAYMYQLICRLDVILKPVLVSFHSSLCQQLISESATWLFCMKTNCLKVYVLL